MQLQVEPFSGRRDLLPSANQGEAGCEEMSRREQTGVVKRVLADRGFGFIRPDDGGEDVWFHLQGAGNARAAELYAGDAVVYELAPGRDSRPQGERVRGAAGAAEGSAELSSPPRGHPERSGGDAGGGWTAVGSRGGHREHGARGGRVGGGGNAGSSFAAAVALNGHIIDCTNAEELQVIVQEQVGDFNHVNVATALHRLARLTKGKPPPATDLRETIQALSRQARNRMPAFNSQAVANTLWAFAKMGVEPERELVGALAGRARATAETFNSQAVANTLWAFAKMGVEPERELVGALAERAYATVGEFVPVGVSMLLWALLRLRSSVSSKLLSSFSELAQSSGDLVLLATVLRAFRRCRLSPDAALLSAVHSARGDLGHERKDGAQVGAGALFGSWEEVARFLQSGGADDRGDRDEPDKAAAETASVAPSQLSEATTAGARQDVGEGLARPVVGDGVRVLARVPAGCSVSWPEGKGPRRLTGAVVPCSEAMGEAAAGPANEMLDGSRGGFVMVGQVVQFGPSGAAFAPPVTLRLPFSAGALADLRAAGLQPRLAAFRWDGGKGCWREVAGEVREVREGGEGVVEVESKSFSSYTVGVCLLALAVGSGLVCYSRGAPTHAAFAARFSPRVPAGNPIEVQVNGTTARSAQRARPGMCRSAAWRKA